MGRSYLLLIAFLCCSLLVHSRNNINSDLINVTNDISAKQFVKIKQFIHREGHTAAYNNVPDAVGYSFDNVDGYLIPCDVDPLIDIDSVMPEQNYCELLFAIPFGSLYFNNSFSIIELRLIGSDVFLLPMYNDLNNDVKLQEQDIVLIVEDLIKEMMVRREK